MAVPVFATGDVPTATQVNQWFVNVIFAYKTANQSIASSIVLTNDTHLFFTVEANTFYHVTAMLLVSAQTAADLKLDWTMPAGSTFNYSLSTTTTAGASYSDDTVFPVVAGTATAIGGLGAGLNTVGQIEGLLNTAGTAGTVRLQWAQNVSNAGGTTMLANSFVLARRVG